MSVLVFVGATNIFLVLYCPKGTSLAFVLNFSVESVSWPVKWKSLPSNVLSVDQVRHFSRESWTSENELKVK